ncbi:MAG TPA: ribonuclease P protein component [Methylocella sp.]|nr:ribonuclease P protein component [Methylocella sp.]
MPLPPGVWRKSGRSGLWRSALDEKNNNKRDRAAPERLKRRADFKRVARGKRYHGHGLTLQAVMRQAAPGSGSEALAPRFGFTVTKQSGGAVRRNRIRRRLKEALRLLRPLPAQPGYDYVIFAQPEAIAMPFPALQAELRRGLGKIGKIGKIGKSETVSPSRRDHRRNTARKDTPAPGPGKARLKTSKGWTPEG